jgi:hypothetical protein
MLPYIKIEYELIVSLVSNSSSHFFAYSSAAIQTNRNNERKPQYQCLEIHTKYFSAEGEKRGDELLT